MLQQPDFLFKELLEDYPMAAAGLLEDLTDRLSKLIEGPELLAGNNEFDECVDAICSCLSAIDYWPPRCPASDRIIHILSRWLHHRSKHYQTAVSQITGWPEDRLAELANFYPIAVRVHRDECEEILRRFPSRMTAQLRSLVRRSHYYNVLLQ